MDEGPSQTPVPCGACQRSESRLELRHSERDHFYLVRDVTTSQPEQLATILYKAVSLSLSCVERADLLVLWHWPRAVT